MRLRLQPLAFLFFASLLFSGCGSGSTGTSTRSTAAAKRSPTELALAHVHAEQTQSARISTSAVSSAEGGGPTTVTILQAGLADDSVAAGRRRLPEVACRDRWRLVHSVAAD